MDISAQSQKLTGCSPVTQKKVDCQKIQIFFFYPGVDLLHFAVDLLSTAYYLVNFAQSTQKYFCIETWAFGREGACHDIREKGSEIMSHRLSHHTCHRHP